METGTTDKFSLRTTIGFLTMPTLITSPACISWVDCGQDNAVQLAFVGCELFKLIERPVGMFSPLGLAQPFSILTHILRDALQRFDSNSAGYCLSLFYNGLGNAVVRVSLKCLLFARQFFKSSFSRFCTNALQGCPTFGVPLAVGFNASPAKSLSVAVSSYLNNAQILGSNPLKPASRFLRVLPTPHQIGRLIYNHRYARLLYARCFHGISNTGVRFDNLSVININLMNWLCRRANQKIRPSLSLSFFNFIRTFKARIGFRDLFFSFLSVRSTEEVILFANTTLPIQRQSNQFAFWSLPSSGSSSYSANVIPQTLFVRVKRIHPVLLSGIQLRCIREVFKYGKGKGSPSMFFHGVIQTIPPSHFSMLNPSLIKVLSLTNVNLPIHVVGNQINNRRGNGLWLLDGLHSLVFYSQINAKHILKFIRGFVGYVTRQQQVILTLHQHQIGFSFLESKQALVVGIGGVGNLQPPANCPDGCNRLVGIDGEYSTVIGDAARSPEHPLTFLIQLVRVGYFGQTPDNQLGTQIEVFLDSVVLCFVKVVLLKYLLFKGKFRQTITSRVCFEKRIAECGSLFRAWTQVYFGGNLHTNTTETESKKFTELKLNQIFLQGIVRPAHRLLVATRTMPRFLPAVNHSSPSNDLGMNDLFSKLGYGKEDTNDKNRMAFC
jgi:hypothetical protein